MKRRQWHPLVKLHNEVYGSFSHNPEQEQSTALIAAQGEAQGQGYYFPLLCYALLI